jgi:aspartate aminotransferase-like enzyme
VVNALSPGDRVLAVSIGNFGDRFARIASAFGADVVKLDFPWGQAADPAVIAERLDADPSIRAVLVTHNETSTGVTNDVQAIGDVVRRTPALLIVDAVSSLAALPLPADEWGLDMVVAGSQKALMIPPGLAFVAVGPRAWQAYAKARMPRHYWDFLAVKKAYEKGQTPYTPAISLLYALAESLRMIQEEGLQAVYNRHRAIGSATRRGVQDLGLRLFAEPGHPSDTVTAVRVPDGMDGKELIARLRSEHRVVVAGGQGPLEGKIFRIGHMGWVQWSEIEDALASLAAVLSSARTNA